MNQTYIYDSVEVRKTGRTATKQKEARISKVTKTDILYEIEPLDTNMYQWKKWVKEDELYTIRDNNDDDDYGR